VHGRRVKAQQIGEQLRIDEDAIRPNLDLHRPTLR
jgi:hypothetical protein